MTERFAAILFGVVLSCSLAEPSDATRSGAAEGAEAALELCHRAERAGVEAGRDLLRRGLRLAEAAVASDRRHARAHLAVFCNLGKQLEAAGIGWRSLAQVRQLKRVIDLALQLAPRDSDILAAKGALLLELPRIFGGDARRGEQLLRHALSLDRDNARAQHYLERAQRAAKPWRRAPARRRSGEVGKVLTATDRQGCIPLAPQCR